MIELSEALDRAIASIVRSHINWEHERIEADLRSIPGVHDGMTHAEALALGLEVVYQEHPESMMRREYRGIRQAGEFVIDHHPEWGPLHTYTREEVAA